MLLKFSDMWRWVTVVLILVILGRPIILINDSACRETKPEEATAVSPLAHTPCHDVDRLAEANTSDAPHSCPCPVMWLPAAEGWTAVSALVSGWGVWVHLPETAVNTPPNPPPRSV